MKQVRVEGKVLGYVQVDKAGLWPVQVFDSARRKITRVRSLDHAAALLSSRHCSDIVARVHRKALNCMKRGWKNGRSPRG